jgi:S1-C subfamily serine protease
MKNKINFLLLGIIFLLIGFIFFTKKDVLVKRETVEEESVVTKLVENSTESVVTISTGEKDIGTGFIISNDGLIVTNKHVVADINAQYRAIIGKDLITDVINIYRDPVTDLAIIKVNKTGLKTVFLGDSDKIKVGQTVIAIGTALGEFRSTVTRGVISGTGRGITAGSPFEGSERLDNVIQTDAAINPGNSGGPLFNLSGEVIGVNVATSQGAQSIGFALPINLVKESLDNFEATGQFDRPYLGVAYKLVASGAGVENVILGSSAQKAGIIIGDIIIEVDDKKLASEKNTVLSTYINRKRVGESVKIKLLRNNQEVILTVILEKKGQ